MDISSKASDNVITEGWVGPITEDLLACRRAYFAAGQELGADKSWHSFRLGWYAHRGHLSNSLPERGSDNGSYTPQHT